MPVKKKPQQKNKPPLTYSFLYQDIKQDTEQIKQEIFSLQIGQIKNETGLKYLTWIITLCFGLTITIGLGTLWKLFEIVKLISIPN